MRIHEIKTPDPINLSDRKQRQRQIMAAKQSISRLLRLIHFAIKPNEHRILQQRLRKVGKKPSYLNMEKYLLGFFLIPTDEIPQPELSIILRSGGEDRLDLFT